MKKTIRHAFITSLPVMAGYVVLGIGFGLMLYNAGYSWIWALLMSVTIYAGSMQYVGVSLISMGAGLLSVAVTTLMVNARHLFYGISMVEKYRDTGKRKPYLIFALTDETYSLVCSPTLPEGVDRKNFYLFLSAMNQCYWIAGSLIGAVLGSVLPFSTAGVDFSMTALFTVVVVEQWEKAHDHLPALLGFGISLACLLIFGTSNFLIPSMIGITAALFLVRPILERRKAS